MRILNISAQKPDSTGSGIYLSQTAGRMAKAGHDIAVLCGVDAADDPGRSLPEDAEVYTVRFNTDELPFDVCGMSDVMPYPATRYRDMTPEMAEAFKGAFRKAIREAVEEFRPDVVLCHHLYLATAVAKEVADDLPADVRPRIYALSHSTELRQLAQHGLERGRIIEAVSGLDGVLSLHEDQKRQIAKTFDIPEDDIYTVGVGYDEGVFNAERGRSQGSSEKAPIRILYAGKISFPKGVPCLLDAVRMLHERAIPATLSLAGGYSNKEQYDAIREQASRMDVPPTFEGRLDPVQLAALYRESDVFVLPSFFEGLPLVVLEALACGCRVVVTDLPGIRDFFDTELPGAPIVYVQPPRMTDVDKPVEADLPAFSERVADAIVEAASLPRPDCDVERLSWGAITERILSRMS